MAVEVVKIEPLTRIEGHVEVELEIDTANYEVSAATAIAALVRGFEKIVEGRHPWDAPYITSRICGVCAEVHHLVSVRALEAAFPHPDPEKAAAGLKLKDAVPRNAVLVRNIIQAAQMMADDGVTHPYLLEGPDIGILADYNPMKPPEGAFPKWFEDAVRDGLVELIKFIVDKKAEAAGATPTLDAYNDAIGKLIEHLNAIDPDHQVDANTFHKRILYNVPTLDQRGVTSAGTAIAGDSGSHYLDAIKAVREGHEIVAIWSGKFPHIAAPGAPGGCVSVPSLEKIAESIGKFIRSGVQDFLINVVPKDVENVVAIALGERDSSNNLWGYILALDQATYSAGTGLLDWPTWFTPGVAAETVPDVPKPLPGFPVAGLVDYALYMAGVTTTPEWKNAKPQSAGTAYGQFVCMGVFPGASAGTGAWGSDYVFPPKVVKWDDVTKQFVEEDFDETKVVEDTTSSFYETAVGHPLAIDVQGKMIDPAQAPAGKYSWATAIKYDGTAVVGRCEAGPLARFIALGPWLAAFNSKVGTNAREPYSPTNLVGYLNPMGSALDRWKARALTGTFLAERFLDWVSWVKPGEPSWAGHLPTNVPTGNYRGFGNWEAPRGALAHWVEVSGGKVAKYRVVTPTNWNLGPRDSAGDAGPIEKSVEGIRVPTLAQLSSATAVYTSAATALQVIGELTAINAIHSFDICTACCVHTIKVGGRRLPGLLKPSDLFRPNKVR